MHARRGHSEPSVTAPRRGARTEEVRMPANDNEYLPPISFAELCEAGRLSLPGADAYAEGYGPVGDPSERTESGIDQLEAFVEAWASAGQAPTEPILPR